MQAKIIDVPGIHVSLTTGEQLLPADCPALSVFTTPYMENIPGHTFSTPQNGIIYEQSMTNP
jgi:hypothetical protein